MNSQSNFINDDHIDIGINMEFVLGQIQDINTFINNKSQTINNSKIDDIPSAMKELDFTHFTDEQLNLFLYYAHIIYEDLYENETNNLRIAKERDIHQYLLSAIKNELAARKLNYNRQDFINLNDPERKKEILAKVDSEINCRNNLIHHYIYEITLLTRAVWNDENPNTELRKAGCLILTAVQQTKDSLTPAELTKELPHLIKFVKGARNLINDPFNEEYILKHYENTQLAISKHYSYGKLIGGTLLCLLGVALISLSIMLAVGTFGALGPFSYMGASLGAAILSLGIPMVLVPVIGSVPSLFCGGYLLSQRKGDLAITGENLLDKVNEKYSEKTQIKSGFGIFNQPVKTIKKYLEKISADSHEYNGFDI